MLGLVLTAAIGAGGDPPRAWEPYSPQSPPRAWADDGRSPPKAWAPDPPAPPPKKEVEVPAAAGDRPAGYGPAPAGYKWVKDDTRDIGWRLAAADPARPSATPGVVAKAPFSSGPASSTTPATSAPVAAARSTTSPGAIQTGRTITLVPGAELFGGTAGGRVCVTGYG